MAAEPRNTLLDMADMSGSRNRLTLSAAHRLWGMMRTAVVYLLGMLACAREWSLAFTAPLDKALREPATERLPISADSAWEFTR
jgi:hypothetical protein